MSRRETLTFTAGRMWTFYLSVALLSVIQIQHVVATGCAIVSVTSPSASTLKVEWSSYAPATSYQIESRVVNSTNISPLTVGASAQSTHKLVWGLRPGHLYTVKLMALEFYAIACSDSVNAMTVPATPQITFSKAISSTSIKFQWSNVTGADSYTLVVNESNSVPAKVYNQTFTSLAAQVEGLTPSTSYDCYVYASNSAGRGARSTSKIIITLVQPPTGVTLLATGKSTVRVTWNSVDKVLRYQVTVSDNDNPSNAPVVTNTSSTSKDISDLEPCSNYTVGVSSFNNFLVPGEATNVTHSTSTISQVSSVSADYSCSNAMVTVTWNLVFGANWYRATAVDSTGASLNCTSASTSCQITMLKCGEKYRVHVTAISDDCESISSTSFWFDTVPCAPANPHTTHVCSSNVIIFSWQPTNNTNFYVATAVDDTGRKTTCKTVDTTCRFTNVGCGQFYTYEVYADSECDSDTTQPVFVRTSPCLPTNIKTSAECNSDTLVATWESAPGALSYAVEAQGNTGETFNCTSSTNSCALDGVPCGEHLSVWIVASNDNCSTHRVLGESAQTVPCPPTNFSASVECGQNSVRVNWTKSRGALFYIAITQDGNGNSHSCRSISNNCLIDGLSCGQTYTASVIATNLKCNSTTSQEVTFTAPCRPTDIQAMRDCDANHALIIWQNHQPTGLYTATMEDQSGAQLTCNSSTVNNCKIARLPCGKKYNVTVTNYDGNCLSTSTPVGMDSVPCSPEDVRASVACNTSELTVTWSISVPAETYTTTISTGMGQARHCNSTDTRCTTGGLLCGSTYMVIVFSGNGTCNSLPSTEVTVHTSPCPPTNVTAVHTCAPDPVPVSWVASGTAKHYHVVAVSSAGHKSNCTTNQTSCSLPGLQCGEVYTIGVSSADDNCTGQLSDTISLSTEPCTPSNVSSWLICGAGAARVFWAPSANAVSYDVKASNYKQTLTCHSTSTNCTLTNLLCGQEYDIVVTATDGTCPTAFSAPFRQGRVPCAPRNVSTNLLCGTNDATVSWIASAAPYNYSATAVPLAGNISAVTCHTTSANCSLSGLQCGQTYNVSVKASSGSCSGPYSPPQTVQTVPCPPQSLTAVTNCSSDLLLTSWNASVGATAYIATVTGPHGFYETCSSSDLTCSVAGLQCASQYNVTVTSQRSRCTSSPSETAVTTGPCDPVNVTSVLQCGSDAATVSWAASAGAVAYTVLAREGWSHHYTSCRSSMTSCQLDPLQCGRVYNLTVIAEDATCNSTGATTAVLMTAPCSPSIQNSTMICGTNSSLLSWTPMTDATGYIVNATTANGHRASCSSTTASCSLTDLMCSETYMTTVTAQGHPCDSAPGTSTNITTTPCPPAITSKQYTCDTNTAMLSWTDPPGSFGFSAQIAGGGYRDSCQTANTSCMFQNLPCGMDFNVTVQAQGEQCNSSSSGGHCESLETVPCAPKNVSATLVCSNHSAMVAWMGSPSAVGYNVTATAQDGHMHHCHANSTHCQIPDIHCGETYGITVTPYSETCTGHPSAAYTFKAGLCAPSNISVSAACEDSTVSWSHVMGADKYIATATADDGHTHTCSSNYSNSCNFTDLHCGETYAVTVVTVDRGCWSEPSSAAQLRTALCPPANLTGHASCDANELTLTWSPVTGATYMLKAERIGGTSPPSEHMTSNTSDTWSRLLCGQRYAFRIAARDSNCSSRHSPPVEMSTAPCQPTNLTARVDCGTNKGNFSWAEGGGAASYTVEVTGEHGHVASCSTRDTSCAVKLHCGRSYSATLVASTGSCNSSRHTDIHFDSAPCLPEDVVAEVDCYTNKMNVSWTQNAGSDDYTAWAVSTDGHRASCNSTSSSCCIHDLQCGQMYEVAVFSSSIHCKIFAGSDYKVQSAPCKPENTTVDLDCSSNRVTVKWNQGSTAQNYTVEATTTSGVNSTCNSTESSCSFPVLNCGQRYMFTVTGYTNVCMSEMSAPAEKHTAPCPPTSVSAELNCTARKALVSWSNAAAASAYDVQATSTYGHNSSCSDMGTSCYLNNLVCGQEYSVVVEAMHTGCPGPASAPVTLTTEPCVPMNVSVHYNVTNAKVMWGAARGASSYSAQAEPDQGLTVTCNTPNTSCSLTGLQCSQIYNVTVMAQNWACNRTVTSAAYRLMTEPCPPTNVDVSVVCEQLTSTVSWQQSDLAVGYVAYFDNHDGHSTSCGGTDTDVSCMASGLMCGTVYNVWVKALGKKYNSSDSSVVYLTSAPCLPNEIEVEVDCNSDGAAVASWNSTYGAANVSLMAAVSGSLQTLCTTQRNICNVTGLSCGETYNLSLTAANKQCSLTAPTHVNLTTRPCPPQRVGVELQCGSGTVDLSWEQRPDVELYTASAVTASGWEVKRCNSTGSTCQFPHLDCGEMYNFTVTAHIQDCSSQPSSTVFIQTEPCQPGIIYAQAPCHSAEAQISWHQASGAVNYLVTTMGSLGYVDVYNTTRTVLSATLPCGQDYNVTVEGEGSQCNSTPSAPAFFTTAPCIPWRVATYVQCESNMGSVSWAPSDGAETYTAVATGLDGHTHHCLTNTTHCTWNDLHCGEEYTVVVRAKRDNCTSLPSNSSVIHMGPCVPQNLSASVNCDTKVVSLSWDASNGTKMYMVSAESDQSVGLSTNVTTASFSDFTCGQNYSLTVTPHSQHCRGNSSASASVQAWPCPPMGVYARPDCLSSIVMVTWQPSNGSDYYTATMRTDTGLSEMCMSEGNGCSVPSLMCGYNFSVSVTAANQQCDTSSQTTSVQSVPCIPTNVSVVMNCANNSAVVSWSASRGAVQYSVTAHSSHCNDSCQTSDLSCSLKNLTCGRSYSVQVVAMDDSCSSAPSQALLLNSQPCPPRSVTATSSCEDHSALVSWMPSPVAETYHVVATAADGHTHTCNSTSSGCSVSGLHCDEQYTVLVTASHENCSSKASQHATLNTGPCQPSGLSVTFHCNNQSAALTWSPSDNAEGYYGCAQAEGGDMIYCRSTYPHCTIDGLDCGTAYNFSVQASDGTCNSSFSEPVESAAVPCPPDAVQIQLWEMEMEVQVLHFSWTNVTCGETQYQLTLTGSLLGDSQALFDLSSYWTDMTHFEIPLPCSSSYSAAVESRNDAGKSGKSAALNGTTAPCPPSGVMYSGDSSFATVAWNASVFATMYTVYDDGVTPRAQLCSTAELSCSFSNMTSNDLVMTASNAAGESETTNVTDGDLSAPELDVTQQSSTVFFIEWTRVEAASYYSVIARKQSHPDDYQELTVYEESFTITDLDTAYCFTVTAIYTDQTRTRVRPSVSANRTLGLVWVALTCTFLLASP